MGTREREPNVAFTLFHPAIVAPTFDNAATLSTVLEQIAAIGLPVLVVNDGSLDATAAILAEWADGEMRTAITHPHNRGKAAALQTGFDAARARGFTHALTIDTDGQHDVADVAPLLARAGEAPDTLWIGTRPVRPGQYPLASRLGRWASNTLVRWESGLRVGDSQCGLRVYPLGPLATIHTNAGRYGYETEILTRCAWAGVPVGEVRVRCIYAVDSGRVSHFRPVVDSLRAARMHTHLLGLRLWRWLSPATMWWQIREGQGDGRFPGSVAVGMFMAVVPLYGIKTIVCLALARVLRLQPLVVLAVSSLNTPPTGPLLAALSIVTGGLALRGRVPSWSHYTGGGWTAFKAVAAEWIVGAVIVGIILALAAYWVARVSVRLARASDGRPPAPSPGMAGRGLG